MFAPPQPPPASWQLPPAMADTAGPIDSTYDFIFWFSVVFLVAVATPRHRRSWSPSTRSSAPAALSSRGEGGPLVELLLVAPYLPPSRSLSRRHRTPETLAHRAPRIAVAMELPELS